MISSQQYCKDQEYKLKKNKLTLFVKIQPPPPETHGTLLGVYQVCHIGIFSKSSQLYNFAHNLFTTAEKYVKTKLNLIVGPF